MVEMLACAICGTDAKMLEHGHKDLVYPRVCAMRWSVASWKWTIRCVHIARVIWSRYGQGSPVVSAAPVPRP